MISTCKNEGMREPSRRELLVAVAALWEAAVVRAQEHSHYAAPGSPSHAYRFSVLNEEQRRTLATLLDRMIPADERSAGAAGAKVDEYIDSVLAKADASLQTIWKNGLERFGRAVQGKDGVAVDGFLKQQSAREFAPQTEDESFFVILKAAAVEGFYTSEIGINKELGYKGMTYLPEFEGCTHAVHSIPDNWRPLLEQPKEA